MVHTQTSMCVEAEDESYIGEVGLEPRALKGPVELQQAEGRTWCNLSGKRWKGGLDQF